MPPLPGARSAGPVPEWTRRRLPGTRRRSRPTGDPIPGVLFVENNPIGASALPDARRVSGRAQEVLDADPPPGAGCQTKASAGTTGAIAMKVFLTGGSGYIGRATIHALVRHGHTVEALVRSDRAADAVSAHGAAPVRGGLDDLGVLNSAAARAEAVVHLAQARTGD